MDYQKQYNKIINNAKNENRIKGKGVYYESHHIIPRCLDGTDDNDNLVLLTAKEHFVCHKLLTYMYPMHRGITLAMSMMAWDNRNKQRAEISANDYVYLKELMAKNLKGEGNPMFGKKHSDETRKNISKNHASHRTERRIQIGLFKKGRHWKMSEKGRLNISKAKKGKPAHNKGIPATEEQKLKCRKANVGRKLSEETKKNISKSNIGHTVKKETRLKISKSNKGKHRTEEQKKSISEKTKIGMRNKGYGRRLVIT